MKIELLVLDVNGVLYRYDLERRIATLADRLGVGPHDVRDAFFDSGLEDAADAGEIAPETYLDQAAKRLDQPLDPVVWADALASAVEPDEEVLRIIASAARRVTTTTLSNNGFLVRELYERIYPRLVELPLEFHVAAEFGEAKPDTAVYLDVCRRFGVAPERAAFVDDKEANAAGAARAGLQSLHYDGDTRSLRDFLVGFGLDL